MGPDMPHPYPQQPQSTGMWSTISNVLTGSNAVYFFLFIAAVLVLLGVLAKLGIFSIHGKGFRIGKNTALAERMLLKKQLEYVQKYCLSLEPQIAKLFEKKKFQDPGAEVFYYRYLSMLISNEMEKWVVINGVNESPTYVQSKVIELKAYVLAQIGKTPYNETSLDSKLNQWVTDVTHHLSILRNQARHVS